MHVPLVIKMFEEVLVRDRARRLNGRLKVYRVCIVCLRYEISGRAKSVDCKKVVSCMATIREKSVVSQCGCCLQNEDIQHEQLACGTLYH